MDTTKVCTKCKRMLPLEDFGRRSAAKDGRRSQCRACDALYSAAYGPVYRAVHKEEAATYHASYRATHKDERRVRDAAYYQENRKTIRAKQAVYRVDHEKEIADYEASRKGQRGDYTGAYYLANREHILARKAAYDAAHKEEAAAYRASRKEDDAAYAIAYRAAHLPEHAARASLRRAVIAGTMIGITLAQKAEIDEIYRRAKEDPKVRCYLCDKLIKMGDRHVDHILPVIKGGPTKPSNLAITCSGCNRSKGGKHPNELGILI